MSNARILVVDDESDIRELLQEILSEEGYEVTTAADAAQARGARRVQNFDLTLLDIWMPDTDGISLLKEWAGTGTLEPVVMMSGHGTVDTAVEATRLGALDFIEKPVSLAKLLHTVEKALEGRRTKDVRRGLLPPTLAPVGKSEKIRAVREQAERVAGHDADTLFSGEPGSGRELFARYLVSRSSRANNPFVVVAGADLTENGTRHLLLDEGTGALQRADGGVLFISELGDIPPAAHQQLLTILGRNLAEAAATGSSPRAYDLRILASASRGYERGDASQQSLLLSHLSMVVISVPPLRDYPEDVPELLRYYVDVLVDTENLPFRRFSVAAQNRLRNYPWPGNVRELRNVVKRLLILGGAEEINLKEAEAQLASNRLENEPLVKQDLLAMPLREAREHFERAYLQQQLLLCGGKVGQLAKRVGMERTHLYRKLRSLGVDFRQPLSEE